MTNVVFLFLLKGSARGQEVHPDCGEDLTRGPGSPDRLAASVLGSSERAAAMKCIDAAPPNRLNNAEQADFLLAGSLNPNSCGGDRQQTRLAGQQPTARPM